MKQKLFVYRDNECLVMFTLRVIAFTLLVFHSSLTDTFPRSHLHDNISVDFTQIHARLASEQRASRDDGLPDSNAV